MTKGKVISMMLFAALVSCMCVHAAFADTPYEPTIVGNDYSNAIDTESGYGIEGIYYAGSFCDQNADTVKTARSLAITIGQDGEGASPIIVTNSTGKDIKAFSVQVNNDAVSDNLLSETLGGDEAACWYFTYSGANETRQNLVGVDHQFPAHYTLVVTLDDDTVAEFHDLNMAAVRTIDLCFDEASATYFVKRTTVSNHTPESMLAYEQNRANAEDVAAYVDEHNSAIVSAYMASPADFPYYAMGLMNHRELQATEDYTVHQELYCTSVGESLDEYYANLHWNSDTLAWSDTRK